MTLPENLILPFHLQQIRSGNPDDMARYMQDMVNELERMYRDLAENVNGQIKSSDASVYQNWTPVLEGSSTPGSFTWASGYPSGLLKYKGNELDIWFNLRWTGTSGSPAGDLRLITPYTFRETDQASWVGVVESNLTLSSGYSWVTCEAVPNNNYINFKENGSGVNIQNLSVASTGQLKGHVRCLIANDR